MAENTDSNIVLDGSDLEDVRQVIRWSIYEAAAGLAESSVSDMGRWLEWLLDRGAVANLLGEPGGPGEARPLEADDCETVADAAELLADMAVAFKDDLGTPACVAFWEDRLELAWRVLLLLEPMEWPTA